MTSQHMTESTLYAIQLPATPDSEPVWEVATKTKASVFGLILGQRDVWSSVRTTAYLCHVGEELAYVPLYGESVHIIVDDVPYAVPPAVNDLLDGFRTGSERDRKRFKDACGRIYDMLLQNDGEAFFQSERFLKEHAPDLYDKLGVGDTETKDLFKEDST